MLPILWQCVQHVSRRLYEQGLEGRRVILKVRFHDFSLVTRSITLEKPIQASKNIMTTLELLLERINFSSKGVRLLGVSVTDLQTKEAYRDLDGPPKYVQLELFDT